MNKFMFAIENIITTINAGGKAILNRSQNIIKNRVIFFHTIDEPVTKFEIENEKLYDRKEATGFYDQVSTNRTRQR